MTEPKSLRIVISTRAPMSRLQLLFSLLSCFAGSAAVWSATTKTAGKPAMSALDQFAVDFVFTINAMANELKCVLPK